MPVPNMARTLNGWTKKRTAWIIQKTISTEGRAIEAFTPLVLDINIQPVPDEKILRKPEEQRSWKWWSLIVKGAPALKTDDAFVLDSVRYRIDSVGNWAESGFRKYEAVEDYVYTIPPGPTPEPAPEVLLGGSPIWFEESQVTFTEEEGD